MTQDLAWREFDYEDKSTAPNPNTLVWIREEFYQNGVTIGYFDGYTFFTWAGSDDCSVSMWAYMEYPPDPKEKKE